MVPRGAAESTGELMAETFVVGDVVTWTSQAKGRSVTKRGEVAEVVPAGSRPTRETFPALYRHSGCGLSRDHESYVVMVKSRPFWPRVLHLHRAVRLREQAS